MSPAGDPSQTALTAAAARAAHLIVDAEPRIFVDPLAAALLGDQAEELLAYHRAHGAHPVLAGARAEVVCRSRFAADRLAAGASAGIGQCVLLGAGLDSFAYRSPLAGSVRTFEVDHPATQRWKRGALARAAVPVPDTAVFVPVDLEMDDLAGRLRQAGFDPARPALVVWLGVSMYLTRAAITRTLAALGGLAAGTEIIADYLLPADLRDAAGNSYAELVAPVAAERGEPWLTFLAPGEMSALLTSAGFAPGRHVGQREAVAPELWHRSDSLRPARLSVIAHAAIPGAR